MPLHGLPGRVRQLPRGPLWVHCQAGCRASIAASLLHAAGHTVTAVDDDFGRAAGAGLPVTGPSGRTSAAALASAWAPFFRPVQPRNFTDDPVSPLPAVRARYAAATAAELVSITGGRHDVLNDVTHRTVAATIVLFLERLRLGAELPRIAIRERIDRAADADPGQAG